MKPTSVADRQKKTRAEKREENKARWPGHPENVYSSFVSAKTVLKTKASDPVSIDNLSVDALRDIMRDDDEDLPRRVEAAECVLGYELPAAALAQETVEPVSSEAYIFLKRIANIPEVPSALRFRALKASSVIESAKPKKVDQDAANNRRRREIRLANAVRRAELRARGMWPKVDSGWFIGFSDDADIPTQTDGRARARDKLLAVRIKNRPDPWDTITP